MSPKVLVISNYKATHTVRPEAEIFIGLANLGFEIHIMTDKSAEYVKRFEEAGITVIDFLPKKKFDKQEIGFIRKALQRENYDIMHLFTNTAAVNGIRAAKGLPVKVLLYRGYTGNINWWDPTMYIKFLHPRVDKIFCNSKGVEELFGRQLFFDKSKAVTINKGHDLAWYENYKPADIKKELGIPDDAFLMINVSNNRRMKGIPYLMKAINRLPTKANIHLLMAGRDLDSPQNIKLLEKGSNRDKVHFLGFRTDVLNIVAACDLFVLPSIKGESITKSVIEAMSLATAALITDIPGNRELLDHGKSGLKVPCKNPKALAEAIMQLYNDRSLCNEMGKNAKKYIHEHLNTRQTVQKTKALYEGLLNVRQDFKTSGQ
jgi:glycosyltransferase involved in cell wall biosynthesis